MQSIVVFIILAIVIGGLFYFEQLPKQEELPQPQETLTQTQESAPAKTQTFLRAAEPALKLTSEPPESKPTISVNTYIVSGPEEGGVIDETNKVTFEFKAKVSPEETEGRIIFETKVEGFDDNWKETSSNQRVINLPSGPKEYTFFVRAKIKDAVDLTPATRTFKINVSPYFKKIKISKAQIQSSSRPSLITLSTYLNQGEEINITGWQIYGKKGSFFIRQGIEKYFPYNPEPTDNIIVKRGDKIYLSGAANPLGRDRNFRPNKCLGYLTNYYDFPISLSKDCPKPTKEEISHLSDCCQDFILNLGKCEAPDYSKKQSLRGDSECTSYLTENFNYAACFKKYYRDGDFLKNQWHIYMEHNFVSKERDILYLKDGNGLIVDTYEYGCLYCN